MSAGRQLVLPLPHAPSFAREDFLSAPSNSAALALVVQGAFALVERLVTPRRAA